MPTATGWLLERQHRRLMGALIPAPGNPAAGTNRIRTSLVDKIDKAYRAVKQPTRLGQQLLRPGLALDQRHVERLAAGQDQHELAGDAAGDGAVSRESDE